MNATGTSETGATPATQDERTWGMIAHLSALVGVIIPFGSIIAPLVIWLVKRDQSSYIAEHAKEALNFNITVGIAGVICWILVFVFIGVLLAIALAIYWLVMTIIAAIKANEGQLYRYPFAIRLVK
jgi:uncharacterized Tic20 family protein